MYFAIATTQIYGSSSSSLVYKQNTYGWEEVSGDSATAILFDTWKQIVKS